MRWLHGKVRVSAARIALVLALGVSVMAAPAGAQVASDTQALPETLTRESARDLLARMPDAQVRSLLLEQLDRAAAANAKPAAQTGMAAMAGMAGVVDQHAGSMRDRYATLADAFVALPATLRDAARRVAGSDAGVEVLDVVVADVLDIESFFRKAADEACGVRAGLRSAAGGGVVR